MATYPEPQKTWNTIVTSTVKRLAMHVESISPSQIVGQVQQGREYYLWLSFKNYSGLEFDYEDVAIRLVGQADQVEFTDPHGSTDYNGKPRIHLHTGFLGSGQSRGWKIRFKARKTIATTNLKFNTGIYGYPVLQGHYWKTFSPTA